MYGKPPNKNSPQVEARRHEENKSSLFISARVEEQIQLYQTSQVAAQADTKRSKYN